MSDTATRWPRAAAERIGMRLIERLKPHCRQVMLCGSIRRRRPDVGDIDIVVESLTAQRTVGLLGEIETCERVRDWASRLVAGGEAEWVANGPRVLRLMLHVAPYRAGFRAQHTAGRIGVDLYIADAARFPMTAFLRTGSAEHNRTLAGRCLERGLRLQVAEGRIVHDARDLSFARPLDLHPAGDAQADYERAVYEVLGLDWLPPERRDPGTGNWVRSFD